MKYFFLLLLASIIVASRTGAQRPAGSIPAFIRIVIPLRDSTGIYASDSNSDRLFYYAFAPKGAIRGMLVLFPPNGQPAEESVSANSILIALAQERGLLTVVPSVNHNLYLDSATLRAINAILGAALTKYRPPLNKVVLGGFSLGGMNAIRYTELAYEDSLATVVRPVAVYGIDPPLDWARLYYSFANAAAKNFSEVAVAEANYFLARLNSEFGGGPEKQPATYTQRSMYSHTSPGGGYTRYLRRIPVRIYSDPDINWQLANRRVDYYDMNALDGAAMINQLRLDGNARAEFVNALGKGYRPDGTRHPHSWSLAEPRECVQWVLRCLK